LEAKTDNDFIKVDVKIEGKKLSGMGTNYEGKAPISGEITSEVFRLLHHTVFQ
jgi:hypothetical protein